MSKQQKQIKLTKKQKVVSYFQINHPELNIVESDIGFPTSIEREGYPWQVHRKLDLPHKVFLNRPSMPNDWGSYFINYKYEFDGLFYDDKKACLFFRGPILIHYNRESHKNSLVTHEIYTLLPTLTDEDDFTEESFKDFMRWTRMFAGLDSQLHILSDHIRNNFLFL